MLHRTTRAALVIVAVCIATCSAVTAQAGTVLLSRESSISATGGEANVTDGSQGFDGFSDVVDTRHATANQHSRPSINESSGFTGAFAEGSASSDGQAFEAEAKSNFDLTFQVFSVPSLVSFGGSVGVSGSGSTSVELSNKSTGEIILSKELEGDDGQSIEHSAVLNPGVYSLSVEAAVDGKSTDGMAYYTVSLSIAPENNGGGGGANPIPLPAAAWSAVSVLGAGGLARFAKRFRNPSK